MGPVQKSRELPRPDPVARQIISTKKKKVLVGRKSVLETSFMCSRTFEMAQSVLHRSIADGLRDQLVNWDPTDVAIVSDAVKRLENGLVQLDTTLVQLDTTVIQLGERMVQLESLYTRHLYVQRGTFGPSVVQEEVRHLPKSLVSIGCGRLFCA